MGNRQMDIRYFEYLDRLKRMRDENDLRVRGETVSQRAFNPHVGGSNPSGRTDDVPPHLRERESDDKEKKAKRAMLAKAVSDARQRGLYDEVEHKACDVDLGVEALTAKQ